MFNLDLSTLFMLLGFTLAMYSVVSNDVIQTLGTFISSNSKKPFWLIWAFATTILVITLVFGWIVNDGDLSFGRLASIPQPEAFYWWHLLPPAILLVLTRFGLPVSTTFLVLSIFSSKAVMLEMVHKSVMGYVVAFFSAIAIYFLISKAVEKRFIDSNKKNKKNKLPLKWTVMQWVSTAYLWSVWIMHDLANVFVFLPRKVGVGTLVLIILMFVGLLGLISFLRGGTIQKVVNSKVNTSDIRSATIINLIFASILFYFKEMNSIPMSTTWVFIGLLAGREVAIQNRIQHSTNKDVAKGISIDFAKVLAGLAVSIVIVQVILNVFSNPGSIAALF